MNHERIAAAVSAAVALAAIAAWLPSGNAWAQDAAQNAQNADQSNSLQEVVVTAERRATDVQTTPIAVTAVSGQQLQDLHLNSISDLQTTVPSFTSADSGGLFNSINIRGIGNSAITPIIATGVAVFRDGLLMSETIGEDVPLYDIADTEVLEGPQGTFVGASSTAGAVEINSANPNFRGINGFIEGQLGNYSDTKTDGAVNLPVSDTFAARIAFNIEQKNSFYNDIGANLTPGESTSILRHPPGSTDNKNVRLSLLWKPTDNFQALGKAELDLQSTGGQPGEPSPYTYNSLFGAGPQTAGVNAGCTGGVAGSPQLICTAPGSVVGAQFYPQSAQKPFVLNYDRTDMAYDELLSHYGLELRYTLPDGIVLRSMTGFVHIDIKHIADNDYSAANSGVLFHEIGPQDNYESEEFNIISPTTGKFSWIAGGYWNYRDTPVFTQSFSVPSPYGAGLPPNTLSVGGSNTVNRIGALFGQVTYQFTDALQGELGLRENWDNNFVNTPVNTGVKLLDGLYHISYDASGNPSYSILGAPRVAAGHYHDSVPTGKVGLNWTPITGQFFYLFFARGYKAGGTNQTARDYPSFQPEHVNDYELGWKGKLLDGRVQTQIGGYYMTYQNMQYSIFDATENNSTNVGDIVENLAPSTIKGIEVAVQSKIAGVGVNLGADYNLSKLGAVRAVPDYRLPGGFNSPVPHPQCLSTPQVGCFDYTPYYVSVSGEQNPFSPKLTVNLSVDYAIPMGNATWDPRVTFSHTDQEWDSIFQDSKWNLMGARNLWDASLEYLNGSWTAQLYGKNLSNQLYVISQGNPLYYGPPRQFGVRVSRNF